VRGDQTQQGTISDRSTYNKWQYIGRQGVSRLSEGERDGVGRGRANKHLNNKTQPFGSEPTAPGVLTHPGARRVAARAARSKATCRTRVARRCTRGRSVGPGRAGAAR
jgi:hypothetical protein